jgi:hypothetical protein
VVEAWNSSQGCAVLGVQMREKPPSQPKLTPVPSAPRERLSEREAEEAVLDLVRAMGEGDIFEGLGKLEMLQGLDDLRCDWLEVLQHGMTELQAGLPETTPVRAPKLIKRRND